VNLIVTLATNGTPASVVVDSGPPMLRQAAVDSATNSRFKSKLESCDGVYPLTYRFVLDTTMKCDEERDSSYPHVKFESNVISIAQQPVMLCDPVVVIERIRFRSAKCLYLWRCGSKAS
jgi:hypothetical protein